MPFEFDVHALIPSENAPALEHALHQKFVRAQVNKVNPRKEFFRVPPHELRQEMERMKMDVTWKSHRRMQRTPAYQSGLDGLPSPAGAS